MSKDSVSDRKYHIEAYNPDWAERFLEYKEKIQAIFPEAIIEHFGSTSVPGMSSKPIIDVLVIVSDISLVDEHSHEIEQMGFTNFGEYVMKDSRLFRDQKNDVFFANIHFFPVGHPHIGEMLGLRDYLRSHPGVVNDYSRKKLELFAKYPNNYVAYRQEKDAYLDELKKNIFSINK